MLDRSEVGKRGYLNESYRLFHLQVGEPGPAYGRMVLWIGRDFMSRYSTPEADLSNCFTLTARRGVHLHRPRGEERVHWRAFFEQVERAAGDNGFGDYSVFLRAFRAAYDKSPREWK